MHLGVPSDGPSDFATIILQAFLISTMSAMCPAHLIAGVTNLIPGGQEIMKLVSVSLFPFSHHFLSVRYKYSAQNQDRWVRRLSYWVRSAAPEENSLCSKSYSRPSTRPTQPPIQCLPSTVSQKVKWPGPEADYPLACISTSPYVCRLHCHQGVSRAPPSPCTRTRVSPSVPGAVVFRSH